MKSSHSGAQAFATPKFLVLSLLLVGLSLGLSFVGCVQQQTQKSATRANPVAIQLQKLQADSNRLDAESNQLDADLKRTQARVKALTAGGHTTPADIEQTQKELKVLENRLHAIGSKRQKIKQSLDGLQHNG